MLESPLFHRLKGLVTGKLQRKRSALRLTVFFNSYVLYLLQTRVLSGLALKDDQPQQAEAMMTRASAILMAFEQWCQSNSVKVDEFLEFSVHGLLLKQASLEANALQNVLNSLRELQPSEEMIRQERQELEKLWRDMIETQLRDYWMC